MKIYDKTTTEIDVYVNYAGPEPSDIEKYKYYLTLKAIAAYERGDFLEAARYKEENALVCHRQGKEEDAEKLEHTAFLYRQEYLYKEAGISLEAFGGIPNADKLQEALTDAAEKALEKKDLHYFVEYKQLNARLCRARHKERDAFLLENSASVYEASANEMLRRGNISKAEIERICLRHIADKYAGRCYSKE